ncbi:MAG: alpha/beta hydrolase [Myxococcaceae bacterium]|nr:alpha/beta hydrolase [Myxococcaceae bacterium]
MKLLGRLAAGVVALLVLVVVGLTVAGALYSPVESVPAGHVGRRIAVGDRQLRVHELGEGPPILFVHGSPGSIEDWLPMMEQLAASHRVIAYDRPGHGFSDGAGAPGTLADNLAALRGVVKALDLKDVVVVGHSYGGATAVALAVENPAEVRAFVIVGSRSYPPTVVDPLYRLLAPPVLGDGVARAATALVGPSKMKKGIEAAFSPNEAQIPPGFVEARTKLWSSAKVTAALARESVKYEDGLSDVTPKYAGIRAKLWVVHGDSDPRLPTARKLAETVKGAELTVLENTGHYVQFVRPAELEQVIRRAAAR